MFKVEGTLPFDYQLPIITFLLIVFVSFPNIIMMLIYRVTTVAN